MRQWDRTWKGSAAESLLKEAGTQKVGTYVDKQQTTVAEWVALIPIYEVYDRETISYRGGRHREPWWHKMTARKHLRATLEEILVAAMLWWQEYGRCGKVGGWEEVAES